MSDVIRALTAEQDAILTDMIRWWQRAGCSRAGLGSQAVQAPPEQTESSVAVRVTSTSTTSGYYPGKIVVFDQDTKTWTDYGTVWVYEAEGATLTARHYLGRLAGVRSGVPVVLVDLAGGSSTTFSLTVCESDNTPAYNGESTIAFNQARGFTVTEPSAGRVEISLNWSGVNDSIYYNPSSPGGVPVSASNLFWTEATRVLYMSQVASSTAGLAPEWFTYRTRASGTVVASSDTIAVTRHRTKINAGAGGSPDFDVAKSVVVMNALTTATWTFTTDTLSLAVTKFGVLGATPVVQQSHISDPAGGGVIDAEARTAIASILDVFEAFGFVSP